MDTEFFSENGIYCAYLHIFEFARLTQKVLLTVLGVYSNYKWIIWLYKDVEEFGSTSVFSLHLYEIGPAN